MDTWCTRVLGLALGCALAGPLAAKEVGDGAAAARRLPGKVTFHKSSSEESRAERERRLKRECRGRPNAGACLGFTRP